MQSLLLLIIALVIYGFSLLCWMAALIAMRRRSDVARRVPYVRLPIGLGLIMLTTAAGAMASDQEVLADDFASLAFYLLVLGVLLQIAVLVQRRACGAATEEEKKKEEDDL
ncbi:MAG: hypothetical protein J7K48_08395 [Thermococcus sp.]|nr:hypothetical protein [Thermococcus sp.]